MALTPEEQVRLAEVGYAYHCFVSWPHTMNPDIADSARRVKSAIEHELAFSVARPSVFMDESVS
jgi:hypothetical protein